MQLQITLSTRCAEEVKGKEDGCRKEDGAGVCKGTHSQNSKPSHGDSHTTGSATRVGEHYSLAVLVTSGVGRTQPGLNKTRC